jgi:hypothetical protein
MKPMFLENTTSYVLVLSSEVPKVALYLLQLSGLNMIGILFFSGTKLISWEIELQSWLMGN